VSLAGRHCDPATNNNLERGRSNLNAASAAKVVFIRFPDTKGGTSDFEGKNGKGLVKAIMKGAGCIVEILN
jgi:hypothetical protein